MRCRREKNVINHLLLISLVYVTNGIPFPDDMCHVSSPEGSMDEDIKAMTVRNRGIRKCHTNTM